ncbi:phosphoglucosamine mutase [bacterium]|nr:phosphoglucosamine mutase [bacterium]
MRQLFGTDGMRGVAGEPPLVPLTLHKLGGALVEAIRHDRPDLPAPRIAVGMDTRESCGWIAAALARGVADAGGTAVGAGVLPTPALALIVRDAGFAAGLMISASHNPYHDNGVKVFDCRGAKLPDEIEAELERRMGAAPDAPLSAEELTANPPPVDETLRERYLAFLERCLAGARLEGLSVVLDAANGAASVVAPEAFRRAGARVTTLADAPDGRNINDGCGSLHPERMAREVVARGADVGFAFDGDADRCIGATRSGRLLDGDFSLYYAGRALRRAGRLASGAVVATVMSNLGLEKALAREGIAMLRAPVGDRYVLEAMRAGGHALGGEQSGHIIFGDLAPTGDGTLTALLLASFQRAGAGDVEAALDELPRFPQRLRNTRVSAKPRIEDNPVLAAAVRRAETELGADGRVVVRYSGTEPLARVMIEGPEQAQVDRLVDEIIDVFRREVGA